MGICWIIHLPKKFFTVTINHMLQQWRHSQNKALLNQSTCIQENRELTKKAGKLYCIQFCMNQTIIPVHSCLSKHLDFFYNFIERPHTPSGSDTPSICHPHTKLRAKSLTTQKTCSISKLCTSNGNHRYGAVI